MDPRYLLRWGGATAGAQAPVPQPTSGVGEEGGGGRGGKGGEGEGTLTALARGPVARRAPSCEHATEKTASPALRRQRRSDSVSSRHRAVSSRATSQTLT